MIGIITTIIFVTGVRVTYMDWIQALYINKKLTLLKNRGFHPDDCEVEPCKCSECINLPKNEVSEHTLEMKQECYLNEVKLESKGAFNSTILAIHSSGIVLLALYFLLKLIFKF